MRRSCSWRRGIVGVGLLLAGLVATSPACRPAREGTSLFRIIDLVEEKNVVRSPLKVPAPGNASLAEIAGEDILDELGTGPNPFLIKRKLHVGPADVNALVAVPPTEIRLRLKVPPAARLEFNYGIRHDAEIFGAEEGERRAEFSVILAAGGNEEKIFDRSLSLGPRRPLVFNNKKIDLSGRAGEDVEIRLITEGDGKALAFWMNPVVYGVREDARYVILISLDTLRADHLTCYGYPRDTSPGIDALARDGIRFSNVVASAPWTLPSHMSLMTSLNPVHHGVNTPSLSLNPQVPTLAGLLKARGFHTTALTGGVLVSGFYGFNKGFESYRVIGDASNRDSARLLGVTASNWIRNNKERSFFLFLHSYQIHDPFSPEPPFNRRYLDADATMDVGSARGLRICYEKRFTEFPEAVRRNIVGLYDGEIRYTDETLIGPIVARLKSLGIYDRTMIVLTSDHGEEFFEHGAWLHTHSVYNEVLRVPLIIKHFGSRGAGTAVETYVRGVDVMPTICRELGIGIRPGDIDGRSLQDLGEGKGSETAGERIAVGDLSVRMANRFIPPKIAIFRFPHKFIFNAPYSPDDLAYYANPPRPVVESEIYDLAVDPGETVNLAGARPELVAEFRELIKRLFRPRKGRGPRAAAADEDLEKQLKTLGYL